MHCAVLADFSQFFIFAVDIIDVKDVKRIAFILISLLASFFSRAGGIYTAEDLAAFARAVNQFQSSDKWRDEQGVVCLEADIDMSKVRKFETVSSFGGIFDGKGHCIRNWKAKSGLFGVLLDGGEIRNLVIDKSCFLKATNSDEEYAVGFIVDHNRGVVSNCENYGTVAHKSAYTSEDVFVGGLAGKNSAVIFRCRKLFSQE